MLIQDRPEDTSRVIQDGFKPILKRHILTPKRPAPSLRRLLASFCGVWLASSLLGPGALQAQQKPWSPLKPDIAELVTDGVLSESPLTLPFQQVSTKNVTPDTTRSSQDFEITYNAPYDEVFEFFNGETARNAGHAIINAEVYPEGAGYALRTSGSQEEKGGTQFRLSNGNISRDFLVLVEPQGDQTRVTFLNIVLTNISSGVTPSRHGFIGYTFSKPLPFNWN